MRAGGRRGSALTAPAPPGARAGNICSLGIHLWRHAPGDTLPTTGGDEPIPAEAFLHPVARDRPQSRPDGSAVTAGWWEGRG
jgi:hypothetical protein